MWSFAEPLWNFAELWSCGVTIASLLFWPNQCEILQGSGDFMSEHGVTTACYFGGTDVKFEIMWNFALIWWVFRFSPRRGSWLGVRAWTLKGFFIYNFMLHRRFWVWLIFLSLGLIVNRDSPMNLPLFFSLSSWHVFKFETQMGPSESLYIACYFGGIMWNFALIWWVFRFSPRTTPTWFYRSKKQSEPSFPEGIIQTLSQVKLALFQWSPVGDPLMGRSGGARQAVINEFSFEVFLVYIWVSAVILVTMFWQLNK